MGISDFITGSSVTPVRRITEPGIYDMPAEEYHGDPCPEPSLGSTGARKIVSECPAAFWFDVIEPKEEFEIGNAAHLLILQPEEFEARIGRIPFDDYKKKDAQIARDDIRASGRIPLTLKQVASVEVMRDAIFADPIASLAFQGGKPEQAMFWKDAEFGIWCKTRPDWLPDHRRYLVDVKTSTTANPDAFTKSVVNFGYHQQAAWYLDGVEAVTGDRPKGFAFVVVSKKAPHLVTTCWLDDEAIEWGRILNRYAKGVFAWCVEHDHWPSYRPVLVGQPSAFTIKLPAWASRDLQARHEAGEFTPPQEIVA